MNLNLTVGKVPGNVKQITISTPATVYSAMQTAASVCNFSFSKDPYGSNGKEMVDVPFLNGRELAIREGEKITSVLWDTPVGDGDIILLVPKIKGNQFLATIAKVPGQRHTVALLHASEQEAQPGDGTVKNALQVAGLDFDPEREEITVNGAGASLNTVINNGDEVVIRQKPEPVQAPVAESALEPDEEIAGKKFFTAFKCAAFKIGVSRDFKCVILVLRKG